MQIINPYQVQRLAGHGRGNVHGLGAICSYTPGCACKEEIQPLFDDASRVRNEVQALLGNYATYVPQWLKDHIANLDGQYQKIYESFKRADERCYGNWKQYATGGKADYERALQALNNEVTKYAGQINQASSASSGGSFLPVFGPSTPLIPGTSAELNPWLIAGSVGVALFIGYKLMRKVN